MRSSELKRASVFALVVLGALCHVGTAGAQTRASAKAQAAARKESAKVSPAAAKRKPPRFEALDEIGRAHV